MEDNLNSTQKSVGHGKKSLTSTQWWNWTVSWRIRIAFDRPWATTAFFILVPRLLLWLLIWVDCTWHWSSEVNVQVSRAHKMSTSAWTSLGLDLTLMRWFFQIDPSLASVTKDDLFTSKSSVLKIHSNTHPVLQTTFSCYYCDHGPVLHLRPHRNLDVSPDWTRPHAHEPLELSRSSGPTRMREGSVSIFQF